eukprot:CAMPEP_0116894372 /NCGR_PEP_ID=MMETSP0467-20121206/4156_1 /TAXON_ID=283647 /ORGANISM="Mesodinium pulex, Strain SPMC105" /LENGTH=66 /DNA_ID=CAMNT_0004564557 /DNA_START=491 /DNA_END=691 /DNA_ORIENTATION=-
MTSRMSPQGFKQRMNWVMQNISDLEFSDKPQLILYPLCEGDQIKMFYNRNKLKKKEWSGHETYKER